MSTNGRYLSMPDPCPHISRLDVAAAKLSGDGEGLEAIWGHIDECQTDLATIEEQVNLDLAVPAGPHGATMFDAWTAWGFMPEAGEQDLGCQCCGSHTHGVENCASVAGSNQGDS